MGSNFATDLTLMELDLETQIGIHLSSNHYPPVPSSMIAPCIESIDAYHDEDFNREINLPDGVYWRNQPTAPASAIIEAHHLGAWCYSHDD